MEQGDPWVKVATTHLTEKMPSNPKKKGLIAVALKRVTTMAEGAPKGNSSVPRGVAAMVAAKKGGGGYPIRAAAGTL